MQQTTRSSEDKMYIAFTVTIPLKANSALHVSRARQALQDAISTKRSWRIGLSADVIFNEENDGQRETRGDR